MKKPIPKTIIAMSRNVLLGLLTICFLANLVLAEESPGQTMEEVFLRITVQTPSVQELFDTIKAETPFSFFYNKSRIETLPHRITLTQGEQSVADVLRQVSSQTGLKFSQLNATISVRSDEIFEIIEPSGQEEVTGTVTDAETGETLPGVNILIQGTSQGTTTDIDGEYQINTGPDDVLVFSYVGYETTEVPIEGRNEVDVEMSALTLMGEELIVVGYDNVRRENLTGSVESVNADEINFKPVGQTSLALQGVSPGLTITQSSGQPGENGGQIRIRGIGTLNAGANPLVLVDGVEMDINNIDPSDIQSISVLKDAAASAIYGSRASNGVILVTTKRANQGAISVDYNSYVGWQNPTNMPTQVNGLEHMLLLNEANRNMGQDPTFQESYIEEYRQNAPSDLYPDTDWQDLTLTNNGLMQNHSLSVSGGSEIIRIRGSINYLDEKGLIPNTGYKRTSIRINSDIKASNNLNFRVDLRGSDELQFEPSGGISTIFQYLYGRVPSNQEGVLTDGRYGQGWLGTNPVALANSSGYSDNRTYNANVFLEGVWQPLNGLEVSMMYAPEFNLGENKSFRKTIETYYGDGTLAYINPRDNRNRLLQQSLQSKTDNLRALVNYSFDIKESNIKALVGYEQIENSFENFEGMRENFTFEDYPLLSLGSEENQRTEGFASEYALQSFFGRINYDLKGKYLFEANLRYDGSSRFAEENRFGIFPSFSAGWRISQEEFFENIKSIDDLKLRASWGRLGNQEIGNYPYASSISLVQNYIFNNESVDGAASTELGNPNISWETTEMFNTGLDIAFLSSFLLKADFFIKNTSDILLRLPIPATVGRNAPFQNAGEVKNTGWELSINHFKSWRDFGYDIKLSVSDVKNEIVDLKDTGPYIDDRTIRAVGHPIDAIYGYESDGLFQSQQEVDQHATQFGGQVSPGDIKYIDQNGDGNINGDDRVVLGSTIPRYTFGVDLGANYKNFDIRVFFQGVGETDSYRDGCNVWAFYVGCTAMEHHKDRWTPENTDAPYPRLTFNYPNNEQVSDYWMKSAAYLRLKNLTIGYNLPTSLLENIKLQNARLYFSGQNLFTVDNFFEGFDVEAPLGTGGFYPMVKTYTFGVNISF